MTFDWIAAFDPGKTTGWAIAETSDPVSTLRSGEVHAEAFGPMLRLWLHDERAAGRGLLVAERFTITRRTARLSQQPDALMVIGVIRDLASEHGHTFEQQAPAVAKLFAPNRRLREWGVTPPPKQGHATDAIRHLLLALAALGVFLFEPFE